MIFSMCFINFDLSPQVVSRHTGHPLAKPKEMVAAM